jgi:hypothetical protein
MPSKLLIAAAETAYQARHAEPFGVQFGPGVLGMELAQAMSPLGRACQGVRRRQWYCRHS